MTATATKQEINAAFGVMRKAIDATGWGGWVSNDKLLPQAVSAANACVAAPPGQAAVAVFKVLRTAIDATGWGGWVSDAKLQPEAADVVTAVRAVEPKPVPTPSSIVRP